MLIKNIQILSLGLALLTTTLSCFSAETAKENLSPIRLLEKASTLYTEACAMPNSLKQADSFEKVINLLDRAIPQLSNPEQPVIELKGLSLRQQAVAYHNYAIHNTKPCQPDRLDFLEKAWEAMRGSRDVYRKQGMPFSYDDDFFEILSSFSTECCLHAHASKNSVKSLDLFTKAIELMKGEDLLANHSAAANDLLAELRLSLHKIAGIYTGMNTLFTGLCQTNAVTIKCYRSLINTAHIGKQMVDYLDKYTSSLRFIVVKSEQKEMTKGNPRNNPRGKGGKGTATPLQAVESVLQPEEFTKLVGATYCGALQKAALIMDILAAERGFPPRSQAKHHSDEAFHFYKGHVYQGEYSQMPEMEQAFILARLDDIIGNPLPLAEFYKQLHQLRKKERHERFVQLLKEEQEAHRQQEERDQKEKQRRELEKPPQKKGTTNAPVASSSEPRKEDTLFLASSSEKSLTPPSNVTPSQKKKVKTRGVPNKGAIQALSAGLPTIAGEEGNAIVLPSDLYRIFQSLTGGVVERNIPLEGVKKLLGALKCTIVTGKGSHQKATAPNEKVWTIPPSWGNDPIPTFYRQQLNEFLQNAMGIDPEDVREK